MEQPSEFLVNFVELVRCLECRSYMELRSVSDIYGGSAICDRNKCNREIGGDDCFWHCSACFQKASNSNGEDVGYDLCITCGVGLTEGIVIADNSENDIAVPEDSVSGVQQPQSKGVGSTGPEVRMNGNSSVTRTVFMASEYNSQRNFQFVADSAEALATIMRHRGCIFDASALVASGSDGLRIQGYKIYRQTIKLSPRDMRELKRLDDEIAEATIANDDARIALLQVERSEFVYVLGRSQNAADIRGKLSRAGYSSSEIKNIISLKLTPLSMREVTTASMQVGEEVARAAITILSQYMNGQQIFIWHCGSINHWVTVAMGSSLEIFYFDSLLDGPTEEVKKLIREHLGSFVPQVNGKINVIIPKVQRQTRGSNLCLFYSAWNAFYFLQNANVRKLVYDESVMRPHFAKGLCARKFLNPPGVLMSTNIRGPDQIISI